MGATASMDLGREAKYRAFLDLKNKYETEYRAKLSAGTVSDEELMKDFRERFIAMVNSEKYNSPLSEEEKLASRRALLAMLSADADGASSSGRGVRVGDVVKVMDDGFWVEGVIVAMHDLDHVVVDFGVEMLGSAGDLTSSALEISRSRSGGSGGDNSHTHDHDYDHDAHGEEDDTFSEGKDSHSFTLAKKTVKASECILVLSGEELEVGDKVEVCPNGGYMFFVGYIWKIHRKFDHETSHLDITYDVCMENSDSGEALAPRAKGTMQERILAYEDQLRSGAPLDGDLDIEFDVRGENIRKLLSGRIVAMERWRSAWRKVTAMLAFKGGPVSASALAAAGGGGGGVGGA